MQTKNPISSYAEQKSQRLWDMRPFCQFCGKRVDRIQLKRDWGADMHHDVTVEVECHGAIQTMRIDPKVLTHDVSEPGIAFDFKGLPLLNK